MNGEETKEERGAGNVEPPGFVRRGLTAALVVMVLDQVSKWWIIQEVMQPPTIIPVTPFFNLVLGWNRGVSFGLFSQYSAYTSWVLIVVALVIIGVLLVWLRRTESLLPAMAIGLVVGGALGNVIDRVRYGAVADFLDFHVGGYHWPAFNVADTAIFIGACALIFDSLFTDPERLKNKPENLTDEKP